MASKIFIEKHGDRLTLHAPDDANLDTRALGLGGHRKGGSWTFPANQAAAVSKLAQELFGTTGDDGGAKVTLRVDLSLFGEGSVGTEGEAWLAGRLLARRPAHDSRVHLGEGVKLIRGGFGVWGGSKNHPALDARFGTVVDVEGVPRAAADLACQKYPITTAIVQAKEETVVGPWTKVVVTRPAAATTPAPKPASKPASKPATAPKAASTAKAKPAAKPKAKKVAKAKPAAKATAKKVAKAKPAAKAKAKKVAMNVKKVAAKAQKVAAKAQKVATAKAKKVAAKAKKVAAKAQKVAAAKAKVIAAKAGKTAAKAKAAAAKARKTATSKAKVVTAKARKAAKSQAKVIAAKAKKTVAKAKKAVKKAKKVARKK